MTDNSRVRVSIVGVVIVALFCALLSRLWFLQMGAQDNLKVQAVATTTRAVQTEMPRGRILDRNGKVLVDNKAAWAITVSREISVEERERVLGQLAEVVGSPVEDLEARFSDLRQSPLKPAIVAFNVDEPTRVQVLEHIEDYPGVNVVKLTVREYPYSAEIQSPTFAANLLGYVGEIGDQELAKHKDDGYQQGDTIGKAGAERAYESDLRGEPRRETLEVDPRGMPVGAPTHVNPGHIGNDVYLSIDANVQHVAEESLAQGIEGARHLKNANVKDKYETLKAPAGAVVVQDVRDGSIVALATNPSYDPSQSIDGFSDEEWRKLNDPAAGKPLIDRATQEVYAPGSTFKLVTAIAMQQAGIRSANQTINDNGALDVGDRDFKNANGNKYGRINLSSALTVSSDVYFYGVGYEMWKRWKANNGDATGLGIQTAARELGFGAPTGIELDEAKGLVPDPEWKKATAEAAPNYTEDEKRDHATWYPFDMIGPSVGQGAIAVTPLQLANAYSAFANGNTLWTPHIGMQVKDQAGSVVRTVDPKPLAPLNLDQNLRSAMSTGFSGALNNAKGTAHKVFENWQGPPIAGKTGTAQVQGKGDTSWFATYFPADNPQYVVVVAVEEGGWGASVAAPVARRIAEGMTSGNYTLPPVNVENAGND
jgi:penicillin-binding protein 2